MEVIDILKALTTNTDYYPKEAQEDAYLRLDELKPILLESLEYAIKNPKKISKSGSVLHINALFLFAKARDHDAFPLVLSIFRLNQYAFYNLLSAEVMVFFLHRILASVFNGDIDSLKKLLEEPGLLENTRCTVLKALCLLVLKGKINRDSTVSYLRNLWDIRHLQHMEIFRCELEEMLELLEGNDPDMDLSGNVLCSRETRMNRGEWEFIDDLSETVDLYESDEDLFDLDLQTEMKIMEYIDNIMCDDSELPNRIEDIVNENSTARCKKIGRNEPCSCGSGKKYKKCCGRL